MTTKALKIKHIQYETDRQLLVGEDREYIVAAPKSVKLSKGDTIYYETHGTALAEYLGVLE